MASEFSESRLVDKFDGTNFHLWKVRMQMYLLDKDLWRIVDGSETRPTTIAEQPDWDKRDGKARANILLHLKDSQLLLVNSLKTSKEMWDGLCNMFETKHATTKMYLNQKIYSMKMSEEDSVADHVNNFKSMIEQLATAGVTLSNEDSAVALLGTLR